MGCIKDHSDAEGAYPVKKLSPAEKLRIRTAIPTRIISNGEYDPLPQTADQRKVEEAIVEMATEVSKEMCTSRREVLQSSAAIVIGLLGLNKVFGEYFDVSAEDIFRIKRAEAATGADSNRPIIFDMQTHLVKDDFHHPTLVKFAKWADTLGVKNVSQKSSEEMERFKLPHFLREIFIESQTDAALLSGAPFSNGDPLPNDLLYRVCDVVNDIAGAKVLYANHVVNPNISGWLKSAKTDAKSAKPRSWKLFPVGDPLSPTGKPWRLDDKKLMYPFYEMAMSSGVRNITIHKGLTPSHYESKFPAAWKAAQVDDLKAVARDWPELNFIIFHSALRPFAGENLESDMKRFEDTGEILWVSDLVRIVQEGGFKNVYAEIGTSFASSCVTNPRFCAAFIGTLLNGVGEDRILWGTDSVWYGSPQWQIEAFKALRIPGEMMAKRNWKLDIGSGISPIRKKIFSENTLRLLKLPANTEKRSPFKSEWIEKARSKISKLDHRSYGYYAKG